MSLTCSDDLITLLKTLFLHSLAQNLVQTEVVFADFCVTAGGRRELLRFTCLTRVQLANVTRTEHED